MSSKNLPGGGVSEEFPDLIEEVKELLKKFRAMAPAEWWKHRHLGHGVNPDKLGKEFPVWLRQAFSLASFLLEKRMPYLLPLAEHVVVVLDPRVGTAGMSRDWVMYFSPAFLTWLLLEAGGDPDAEPQAEGEAEEEASEEAAEKAEEESAEEAAELVRKGSDLPKEPLPGVPQLSRWLAGLIVHELQHGFLEHFVRAGLLGIDSLPTEAEREREHNRWNSAADVAINQPIHKLGWLPPRGLLPSRYNVPENLAAEDYYHLLKQRKDEGTGNSPQRRGGPGGYPGGGSSGGGQSGGSGSEGSSGGSSSGNGSQGGGGDSGSGEENSGGSGSSGDDADSSAGGEGPGGGDKPFWGGSIADGRRREWEDPTDREKSGAGKLDPNAIKDALAEAAQQLVNGEGWDKKAGTTPAELIRRAKEILGVSVPWRKILKRAVGKYVGSGRTRTVWDRPSRITRSTGWRIMQPGWRGEKPTVYVLADTSGSMEDRDLGAVLGVLQSAFRRTAVDEVFLITFDAASYGVQRVRSRDLKGTALDLKGGGGTDLKPAVEEMRKHVRKQRVKKPLVLYITDLGIFDWPESAPVKGTHVVVVVPSGVAEFGDKLEKQVPSWVDLVVPVKK